MEFSTIFGKHNQTQWPQKTSEELHQQLTAWGVPFDDVVVTQKHRLINIITLEEFRRRIASFPTPDDTNDPDGDKRRANFEFALHYDIARATIQAEAFIEYHTQKMEELHKAVEISVQESKKMIAENKKEAEAHLKDPDNFSKPPSVVNEIHVLKEELEKDEGFEVEAAEMKEQDNQAVVRSTCYVSAYAF